MPSLTAVQTSYNPQSLDRWLAEALPDSAAVEGELPLELTNPEPPRLSQAVVIEGRDLVARRIEGAMAIGFVAFLDGRQSTTTKRYLAGGVPIVLGSVGAAIRERRDRRLFTWEHRVERALYVSRAHLRDRDWQTLRAGAVCRSRYE